MILVKDSATGETPVPGEPVSQAVLDAVAVAFARGKMLADEVNARLLPPMFLEPEKAYGPYLLLGKKKYLGMMWMHAKYAFGLDAAGIEMVRRDNPQITGMTCQTFAELVVGKWTEDPGTEHPRALWPDVELAKLLLTEVHRRMLCDELPLEAYVITGKFGKPRKEYKVKVPHVELAHRIKMRDPGSAPQLGSRIPYVIVTPDCTEAVRKHGGDAELLHERSEDPNWVKKYGLTIDTVCYATRKFEPAFLRLLAPIMEAETIKSSPMNPMWLTRQTNRYRDRPEKLEAWKKRKRQEHAETKVKQVLFQDNYRARKIRKRVNTQSPMAAFLILKQPQASAAAVPVPTVVMEESDTEAEEPVQVVAADEDEVDPAHDLTGDTGEDMDAKARIKLLLDDALMAARTTLAQRIASGTPVMIKPRRKQSTLSMFFKHGS